MFGHFILTNKGTSVSSTHFVDLIIIIPTGEVTCHKSKWGFWVVLTSLNLTQGPIWMILVANERSH